MDRLGGKARASTAPVRMKKGPDLTAGPVTRGEGAANCPRSGRGTGYGAGKGSSGKGTPLCRNHFEHATARCSQHDAVAGVRQQQRRIPSNPLAERARAGKVWRRADTGTVRRKRFTPPWRRTRPPRRASPRTGYAEPIRDDPQFPGDAPARPGRHR
ncbi:hypothetical protein NCAST_21_01560 [Nocardia asteroides NBRC 15531]|uniref:Uncharacterized protein n=1 Tax=Nocardia asteroides NBRC 15531 TaxID=1110697 RepID=U5EA34_NOCAS|nr:hypothetical protein NCAST_21_01560 [Nocardia asteroides NBRC 15531]